MDTHKKKNDKPTAVRIEKAERGELVEIVTAPGQIEPRRKVDISTKVAARIVELPFEEGQQVKKDDVLIRLDSRELESRLRSIQANYEAQKAQIAVNQANIEQQKAALQSAEASRTQAETELKRHQTLLESRDISQAVYDRSHCTFEEKKGVCLAARQRLKAAELELVVMQHNLRAARERIEQAKQELSYTTIVSPMDGIVTRINAEEGEMVMTGTMNNAGTIILQVADLSQMLLMARVDEADIGKLKIGQKANIRVQAYWGHIFTGTIDSIALTHDVSQNRTKYYKTEILIEDDPDHPLFSGLTADVDIETHHHNGVIKVPTQAVIAQKIDDLPLKIRTDNPLIDQAKTDALLVFKLKNDRAITTPVQIGESDMSHIIITAGLEEGDPIVVGPYKELDKLKHWKRIAGETKVEEEKKAAKKKKEAEKEAAA